MPWKSGHEGEPQVHTATKHSDAALRGRSPSASGHEAFDAVFEMTMVCPGAECCA
jgi:hypothetical protein